MMVALAGWINRQQQDVIEYLHEEVRVLRELQGRKRLRFSDDQSDGSSVKLQASVTPSPWYTLSALLQRDVETL